MKVQVVMGILRRTASAALFLMAACSALMGEDQKSAIKEALVSRYALTTPTADKTDIVTAGSVLVLKKSNLMMVSTATKNLYQNSYKGGKITQNALGKVHGTLSRWPGNTTTTASDRTFVAGEKVWVTNIEVKDNGVVFALFTDAYNDVRYEAALFFPFGKGATPSMAQVDNTVAEVFAVQGGDDTNAKGAQPAPAEEQKPAPSAAGGQTLAAAGAAPAKEAPPAPIAPPPPPSDAPVAPTKTVSLGQSPDQVVGILGQPEKIIKLNAKQVYVYKDMKLTFVGSKLTDVQ